MEGRFSYEVCQKRKKLCQFYINVRQYARCRIYAIVKKDVNLLSYLRTYVYSPTYGNGLKEIAGFLDYEWKDKDATGF